MLRIVSCFALIATSFAFAACSSGGGGMFVGDAGFAQQPGESDAGTSRSGSSDAGRRDAARTDPQEFDATCAGLCSKALAELGSGCNLMKCSDQCEARRKSAGSACANEWNAFLECAVQSGSITSCGSTGKVNIAGCGAEEADLNSCASAPRKCVSNCTSDVDCQLSCPTTMSVACCDTMSGVCYAPSGSTCSGFVVDSGIPPSY